MWIRTASFILRNRLPILIVLVLITAFMGIQSRKIEMSYQYAPLLPEDDPANLEYDNFIEEFGNEGNLIVLGIQDRTFFEYQHFGAWQQLTRDLKKINGITSVFSATEAYNLTRNNQTKKFELSPVFEKVPDQSHLDSLRQKFNDLSFYKGLVYNPETNTYLMAITLDRKVLESEARVPLIRDIKNCADKYSSATGNEVHISGLPYIRVETAEMIKKELNMFIWLALGITAIIIFLFFKSFKVVLFSMLVVGMAVIWALGLQAIIGYKVTILTGMIPPLIIVIGIPNSVFFLNKFHYEYRNHGNKIKSLQRVIQKIGNATFLTNLTTASGFATFIFTSSKLLIEFGVMAALNIMVVFILSLLLIPIIFSFLPDPKERHVRHLNNRFFQGIINKLVHISLYRKKIVYLGTVGLIVFGGYGISQMKTTGFMLDDIPHNHTLYKDLHFFEKHFSGLMPLEVVIDTQKPKGVMRPQNLKKMDLLQEQLRKLPEISQGLSMVQVVKFARQAFYKGNPNYFSIPSSMEHNFIMSYLPKTNKTTPGVVTSFVDSIGRKARISFRMEDVGTTKMHLLNKKISAVVDSIFPSPKYETAITGSSVVFFKGTDYLVRNLFVSLGLAILLIASFMAWMFRSKRMVLVSLFPNLVPLITTAALMGIFNIPIKPSTILVFSIAFGISVDDTIHFLSKYRQELVATNWSIRAATVLALKETGRSMIYTSVILFFGFGIFTVSSFGGTVALGALVALTLLVALFSNLILLPALLLGLERLITNESFKEPMLTIYNEEEDIDMEELKIQKPEIKKEDIKEPEIKLEAHVEN
ncbi:efflux RND transporter permease subunit [Thermophagus sp. OGC60D27]|uniref:efflux RND transporter permease subunit n=1 Tax=Thermophagus sp. OGC60D27 TaxID=3458415 RepID=UPI0040378049